MRTLSPERKKMLITFWGKRAHAWWYSPKWPKTVTLEKNCWINCYFCFLCATKYSRSFIKLKLSHWCHMDFFSNVLTTLLGLGKFWFPCCLCRVRFHQKYLNLCSEDEQRSYWFGTTWGWVINDRIFIFGWTNPLNINEIS